jgi:GTP-binding protein EngB required for normal cell division
MQNLPDEPTYEPISPFPPPPYATHASAPIASQDAPSNLKRIRKNVIVFGETGAGKSSVINMLLGDGQAQTSNSARGCTFESNPFPFDFPPDFGPNKSLTLWDTAGFNEGDVGTVPSTEAMVSLYKLLNKLSNKNGVSLLVFVMRGRIKASTKLNWTLFNEVICQSDVPSVVVVTAMENMANKPKGMDSWWEENVETFNEYGITPTGYACVTASKGRKKRGMFVNEALYLESQKRLSHLIYSTCAVEPLQVPPIQWFKTIVGKPWFKFWQGEKEVLVDDILEALRDKCGMKEDDVFALGKLMKKAEVHN